MAEIFIFVHIMLRMQYFLMTSALVVILGRVHGVTNNSVSWMKIVGMGRHGVINFCAINFTISVKMVLCCSLGKYVVLYVVWLKKNFFKKRRKTLVRIVLPNRRQL